MFERNVHEDVSHSRREEKKTFFVLRYDAMRHFTVEQINQVKLRINLDLQVESSVYSRFSHWVNALPLSELFVVRHISLKSPHWVEQLESFIVLSFIRLMEQCGTATFTLILNNGIIIASIERRSLRNIELNFRFIYFLELRFQHVIFRGNTTSAF